MKPFIKLTSHTAVLPMAHIDTDQIIPARFLKVTDKEGLGKKAFHDWRYLPDGTPNPDFALNQPINKIAKILVAGDNFGCGSSREHAPWALLDFGFRAVISTSIADIFRNNALKNGLLPVVVPEDIHQHLLSRPGVQVSIDLEQEYLEIEGGPRTSFEIESFARYCMLVGKEPLDYLLDQDPLITAYETARA